MPARLYCPLTVAIGCAPIGPRKIRGRTPISRTRALERLVASLADTPGLALRSDAPLARLTTLRIGGPAEMLAEAGSERAVAALLTAASTVGVPVQVLGLGSNVLIPDEGVAGVVLRLTGELRRIRIRGPRISAGGGAVLARVARRAAGIGLSGLEALSGFPSTVGGAVYMNAGAYGSQVSDVLLSARVVSVAGERGRISVTELEPEYRRTSLARSRSIVVRALFELRRGDPAALLARIEELNARRWRALPSGVPSAGSVFRNPQGDFAGRLIEECALKGRRRGGAAISDRHANVIVNLGGALATDVTGLMLEAREAVAARFGIELVPELVLIGALGEQWRAATRASEP